MPTDFDLRTDRSPEELVSSHLAFALHIAARIRMTLPRHVDRDDINADAMVGLWSAARRYDARRGKTFTRFAGARIRGAVLDGLRRLHWGVQRPRRAGATAITVVHLQEDESIAALQSEAHADRMDSLASLLGPLALRLRVIAILRYVADYRPTDIAVAMRISRPRVTQLHHRLIDQLRRTITTRPLEE